jgi:hypothetical protein
MVDLEELKEFDEIRPFEDSELPPIYEELIADEAFRKAVSGVIPNIPFDILAAKMRQCKTKLDFQKAFCYGIIRNIADKYTSGLSIDISSVKDKSKSYTYLSNHRDIVLDSGFLSVLLVEQNMDTVEIAIGDNLLIYPWIKKLVRINKAFIVQRALTMRQMLESSRRMSRYMHYTINKKHQSIWMAQREGRAKDANDRTQDSVLKMLIMGGEGDFIDRLIDLNIVPLSISYEYDPCDYLKAEEFQLKRDNEDYKKTTQDDLISMQVGMFGQKGRVHYQMSSCINDELRQLDRSMSKAEVCNVVASLIDRHVHRNYALYPGNYVAHDLLFNENYFASKYTEEEKSHFVNYLQQQLDKVNIANKDIPFLREKLLIMYANPVTNYMAAIK